jgi:NitT/TauT family transport system substrate-binding protein
MALILAFFAGLAGCQQKGPQGPPLELTLAVHGTPYSGLIAVADEKGFFKETGLKVKINLYPSGLDSLKAMIKGEAHVATVTDIAFAINMLEDPSLRTIASIGTSMGSEILARKDRNIHKPADLRGKRIGYSPLTSSDYFLYAFLLSQGISRNDIIAVPIPPARQAEALIAGEIDALSAFDVYGYEIKKKLRENILAWSSQGSVDFQWLLAVRENATQSPEAIKRLLRALIRAEEFASKNEDETKKIISRKWGVDLEYVRYSWDQTRLFVSLNQSIVTALQNYAKWKMNSEGRKKASPDVLHYIYADPLREVDPKLVTIFR